jgi:hypothetical protein
MIPAFNPDPGFFEQALASVLAQDPGREAMEMVVLDDASEAPAGREIAARAGGDRIEWVAHRSHVGIGRNWNACVERARGEWVHILHQDDLLRPGFYERLGAGITACPAAGAAFCRDVTIDPTGRERYAQSVLQPAAGVLEDWIGHVFLGLHLRASGLVVKRSVYEALGGFRLDLSYALDWDMWKRIAAAYPLWYEPGTYVCYRRHRGSESFGFIRSGGNIAEIGRSIALSEGLLPAAVAAEVTRKTRENYTRYAVTEAWRALVRGEVRGAAAQLREGRRLTSTGVLLRELAGLLPRMHRVVR